MWYSNYNTYEAQVGTSKLSTRFQSSAKFKSSKKLYMYVKYYPKQNSLTVKKVVAKQSRIKT